MTDNVNLEIDPEKLKTNEKDIDKNRFMLQDWCDKFLSRIMDPETIKGMPIEVRVVASYIAEVADSLQLDTPILIGSYIMLR